ncbi:hypothetical protein [Geochorda subterranea]|uniref:Uncharacterized protein n=1 Tax=Geochorda subterranea TaxID=3109564 RepID=A0ABZ1BT58_9FIRM|nr:hypothetical protein [Limnochorda sp. LNt]WRP15322.1 hypothetical protein VLY81_03920 [Limnochorda sp. LNt]
MWWRRAAALALVAGAVGLWMRATGRDRREQPNRVRMARRLLTLVNL